MSSGLLMERLSRLHSLSRNEQRSLVKSVPEDTLSKFARNLDDVVSSRSGSIVGLSLSGTENEIGTLVLLAYAYYSLPLSPDSHLRASRVEELLDLVQEFNLTQQDILLLKPVSEDMKQIVQSHLNEQADSSG